MGLRRRRARRRDPLGSAAAVRGVLERVAFELSPGILLSERDLVRAMRAASHAERSGWPQSRRGRRPRFDRPTLEAVWRALACELARETGSAVSPRTFTEHYLRLLACPRDVLAALSDGRINLFEALQLARITPAATGLSDTAAAGLRGRILAAHLSGKGSARQLYERVSALLGRESEGAASAQRAAPAAAGHTSGLPDEAEWAGPADGLPEAYPLEPGALFTDQLRQVSAALAALDPEAVSEADSAAILDLLDQLYLQVTRAARRARRS